MTAEKTKALEIARDITVAAIQNSGTLSLSTGGGSTASYFEAVFQKVLQLAKN